MGLLRADLQSLANGLRRDGRAALGGRLLPPLVLAAMHWTLGSLLLQHRELLHVLHGGGNPLGHLFAHALGPGPVVAGWIGFAQAQRQLFEAPELALWQSAPGWRGRAAVQVWLRAAVTALLWTAALSLPLLLQLLIEARAPLRAFALLPVAIAAVTLPSLAAALAVQILMLRCSRGRATRWLASLAAAIAAFGFPVFLLAQVFQSGQAGAFELAATARSGASTGVLTGAAAHLLRVATANGSLLPTLAAALLPTLGTLALLLAVAPMHPIAVEHHQLATRARRPRRRPWPAAPVAVLRRKELTQLLQQPGAILHMVLVAVLVHLFAAQGTIVRGLLADPDLPPFLQQCAAMLTLWFLAVLMLLYSHMGRLAVWDGAQWPLYVQAPTSPSTLLAAKLQVIAVLLLWPLAVAAHAGVQWFGADLRALLPFCAFAAAGTMVALAVVAAVGTWPWLVRREPDGRLLQGSRGLVGSMALVFSFYLLLSPAFVAWVWLVQQYRVELVSDPVPDAAVLAPPLILVALGIGALLLAASLWLSARNYRRLLAAHDGSGRGPLSEVG